MISSALCFFASIERSRLRLSGGCHDWPGRRDQEARRGEEPIRSLITLGRFAVAMLEDAMAAYSGRDNGRAAEVWGRDKELDQMYSVTHAEAAAAVSLLRS
jgi:hypothetical protein